MSILPVALMNMLSAKQSKETSILLETIEMKPPKLRCPPTKQGTAIHKDNVMISVIYCRSQRDC